MTAQGRRHSRAWNVRPPSGLCDVFKAVHVLGCLLAWCFAFGSETPTVRLDTAPSVTLANEIAQTHTSADDAPPATQAFVHDAAGNLVFDGVLFYQYDGLNRLIRVVRDPQLQWIHFDFNGKLRPDYYGYGLAFVVLDLAYDGLGRLAWVRRYGPGSSPREDYYYDGVRRIQEGSFVGDVTDAARAYTRGPGYVDEVLAQIAWSAGGDTRLFNYL